MSQIMSQIMSKWNSVENILPKENEIVITMSEKGLEQELKRVGKLWFLPDGSMYVYYTPKFWKEINNASS